MGCSESKVNKVAINPTKKNRGKEQNQNESEWPELRTSSPDPKKGSHLDVSVWGT